MVHVFNLFLESILWLFRATQAFFRVLCEPLAMELQIDGIVSVDDLVRYRSGRFLVAVPYSNRPLSMLYHTSTTLDCLPGETEPSVRAYLKTTNRKLEWGFARDSYLNCDLARLFPGPVSTIEMQVVTSSRIEPRYEIEFQDDHRKVQVIETIGYELYPSTVYAYGELSEFGFVIKYLTDDARYLLNVCREGKIQSAVNVARP
jgi:hypothetical protein